jgi:hypothetical protein
MSRVDPRGAEMHGTPGVRRGNNRGAASCHRPLDGRHLAFANRSGQVRLKGGVSAAGTAAQTVVVELDEVEVSGQDPPHGTLRALHVTQVARILHDHRSAGATSRGELVDPFGEPLVHITHACGERRRLRSSEQVPVLLHRRTATGRVDQDRLVPG